MASLIAKNVFTNGMVKDLAPTNTALTYLTDALNATFVTNNGNELSLQNDMGNVKLPNAELEKGYSPVGMCEYGGVIYIASVNPDTNKCQIGSFPGPEYIFNTNDKISKNFNLNSLVTSEKFTNETFFKVNSTEKLSLQLTIDDNYLNPGDAARVWTEERELDPLLKDQVYFEKKDGTIVKSQNIKIENNVRNNEPTFDFEYVDTKLSGKLGVKIDFNIIENWDLTYTPTIGSDSAGNLNYIINFTANYDLYNRPIFGDNKVMSFNKIAICEDDSKDVKFLTFVNSEKLFEELDDEVFLRNQALYYPINTTKGEKTFKVYPVYLYNNSDLIIEQLVKEFTIDFSKIGSGEYSNSIWQYYAYDKTSYINFDLQLYPKINRKICAVTLDFYDNQGIVAKYVIDDRTDFSGKYEIELPLNGLYKIDNLQKPILKIYFDNNDIETIKIYDPVTKSLKDIEHVNYFKHIGSKVAKNSFPIGNIWYDCIYVDESKIKNNLNELQEATSYKYCTHTVDDELVVIDVSEEGNIFTEHNLFLDNSGQIQGNYLYLVNIKVFDCDEKSELSYKEKYELYLQHRKSESIFEFLRWFFTNGMFNTDYGSNEYLNFDEKTIEFYNDAEVKIDSTRSSVDEDDVEEDQYHKYIVTNDWNSSFTSKVALSNTYNLFSYSDELVSSFSIDYYLGNIIKSSPEISIISYDTEDIKDTLPNPELTISDLVLMDGDTIYYLNKDNEFEETNKKLNGSVLNFTSIYNTYSKSVNLKVNKLTRMRPLVNDLNLLESYGISNGDFINKVYYFSLVTRNDDLALALGKNEHRYNDDNLWLDSDPSGRFQTGYSIEDRHGFEAIRNSDTHALESAYKNFFNYQMCLIKPAMMRYSNVSRFSMAISSNNYRNKQGHCQGGAASYNTWKAQNFMDGIVPESEMRTYDGKYPWYFLVMKDTQGKVHLLNTLCKDSSSLAKDIIAILTQIYIKSPLSDNQNLSTLIFHELHLKIITCPVIANIIPPNIDNIILYINIFGINLNKYYDDCINLSLKYINHDKISKNKYIIKNSTKTINIDYTIDSKIPEYEKQDESNVLLETVFGETHFLNCEIKDGKMYYFDGENLNIADKTFLYFEMTDFNNFYVDKHLTNFINNFSKYFTLKSNMLTINVTEVSNNASEYFSIGMFISTDDESNYYNDKYFQNDDGNDGLKYASGGWCFGDKRINIPEFRSYESIFRIDDEKKLIDKDITALNGLLDRYYEPMFEILLAYYLGEQPENTTLMDCCEYRIYTGSSSSLIFCTNVKHNLDESASLIRDVVYNEMRKQASNYYLFSADNNIISEIKRTKQLPSNLLLYVSTDSIRSVFDDYPNLFETDYWKQSNLKNYKTDSGYSMSYYVELLKKNKLQITELQLKRNLIDNI